MFTLIIEDKNGAIADEYTFEEGEFTIGRSHVNDIILPADNISRRHARLFTQASRCFIEDLSSSNGVYVNGKRIMSTVELGRSAQIKIGDFFLYIEGVNYDAGPPPETSEASAPHDNAADPSVLCRLISQNFGQPGTAFSINRPVNLVGRGKDCNLTIIDPSVSRIQAKITIEKNGLVRVEDLKSSNGTYLNNLRIDKTHINHGDRLRFGNVEFLVEMPGQPSLEAVGAVQPFVPGAYADDRGTPRRGGNKGLIVFLVLLVLVLAAMVTYIFFPATFSRIIPIGRKSAQEKKKEPEPEPKKGTPPQPTPKKVAPKVDPAALKKQVALRQAIQLLAVAKWVEAQKLCEPYKASDAVAAKLYAVAAQEQLNLRQLNSALLLMNQAKFAQARAYIKALNANSYYVKKGIQALYLRQIDRREADRLKQVLAAAEEQCKNRKSRACHDGLVKAYKMKADAALLKRIRRLERRMRRRRIPHQKFEPGS